MKQQLDRHELAISSYNNRLPLFPDSPQSDLSGILGDIGSLGLRQLGAIPTVNSLKRGRESDADGDNSDIAATLLSKSSHDVSSRSAKRVRVNSVDSPLADSSHSPSQDNPLPASNTIAAPQSTAAEATAATAATAATTTVPPSQPPPPFRSLDDLIALCFPPTTAQDHKQQAAQPVGTPNLTQFLQDIPDFQLFPSDIAA
ncbi:hypothetical protein GQ42DRAFT_156252 [Ramicandelaber brevisporus]|nr:hypothetical protein GQ42DRAFT_156252 [Ramicandelaber brevisporus]